MKVHTTLALILFSSAAQLSASFVLPLSVSQPRASARSVTSPVQHNSKVAADNSLIRHATTDSSVEELSRDADVIFAIIDADGGGTISKEEMQSHLSEAGYAKDVIDKIFLKMDTNKDDEISKEEFRNGFLLITGLRSAPGLGNFNSQFEKEIREDAMQVFQSADADSSGEIDEFELKSHLGRKFKFSDEAAENMFRMLDINGDKKISQEEFVDAFVRYSALRQAIGEGPNFK